MIEPTTLIGNINELCKIYFTESTFYLYSYSFNNFRISGSNSSLALNNIKNSSEEVTVIKWFKDFWIYIDIKFKGLNTFISLSIFQGETTDTIKNQIIRAEWDDYNITEINHPQPHWHITSHKPIENTFEELASLDDSENFLSLLKEEKGKLIDVSKIHFAMNGNWINDETEFHPIDNNDKLLKWFSGLFSHLRKQLQYVTETTNR